MGKVVTTTLFHLYNMNRTTIIRLKDELRKVAESHEMVNTFFFGEPQRAVKELNVIYPLMCAYVENISIDKNISTVGIRLIICDKIDKDWSVNLDEVISDTAYTWRNIYTIISRSKEWAKIGNVRVSSIINPFLPNVGNIDYVAGNHGAINIRVVDDSCVKTIPLFNS